MKFAIAMPFLESLQAYNTRPFYAKIKVKGILNVTKLSGKRIYYDIFVEKISLTITLTILPTQMPRTK